MGQGLGLGGQIGGQRLPPVTGEGSQVNALDDTA